MSSCSHLTMPTTLPALADQYHYQRCQEVIKFTADKEMVYVRRFFNYFGPPEAPSNLFAQLCPKSISAFLVKYASQYGPGSRRWMHNTLRVFLRFSYRSGYMPSDLSLFAPCIHSRRMGKVLRAIPVECIHSLISSIGCDTPVDLRDRAIICLLAGYGIRGVQVRRLCLEDINWAEDRIYFRAAKRGRPIEQFLTAQVGNSLLDYISKGRGDSSYREVFLTCHEPFEPLTRSNLFSWVIRKRFRQAGITLPEGVSYGSHGFRHAFASALYGKVPFKDIVDMLGHCDPSSTLVYGKIDMPTLKKAALEWPGGVS